ncbi:MAG: endo-1,4-beta-xylanase [Pirellulales bacterium]|nr:endo-1,4-beta-xylanase [Pirellulales bacterium]
MHASLLPAAAVVFACCASTVVDAEPPALKDAFRNDFLVGAALGTQHVLGREPAALELVAREYNTVTPENLLKWAEVHPDPDRYDWGPADQYVDWAGEHEMFVVGHTLVWHSQTPGWVFAGKDGGALDRETALERMKAHIDAVVGRYQGRVHGWDVVNEAILENGDWRTGTAPGGPGRAPGSPWHAAIGDDYIEQAFRMAHEADPEAELYYNDYNEWYPGKIRAISELVNSLQAKGVRIDGVGLQGHWGMDYPSLDEIDRMLVEYGKLGVKLMVTELDINVVRDKSENTGAEISDIPGATRANPYPDGLPPELEAALAQRYAEIFRVLMKHKDKLSRVTFWGVHDGHSWLNNRPPGRKNYPLLFDRKLQPKPAYAALLRVAAGE